MWGWVLGRAGTGWPEKSCQRTAILCPTGPAGSGAGKGEGRLPLVALTRPPLPSLSATQVRLALARAGGRLPLVELPALLGVDLVSAHGRGGWGRCGKEAGGVGATASDEAVAKLKLSTSLRR